MKTWMFGMNIYSKLRSDYLVEWKKVNNFLHKLFYV